MPQIVQVIMLMTSSPKDQIQEISQRKALDILKGKGITVEEVDGTMPEVSNPHVILTQSSPSPHLVLISSHRATAQGASVGALCDQREGAGLPTVLPAAGQGRAHVVSDFTACCPSLFVGGGAVSVHMPVCVCVCLCVRFLSHVFRLMLSALSQRW